MPDEAFVPLAGSERLPIPGAEPAGPLDVSAWIEVTLITRRKAELPADLVAGPMPLARERFEALYGTTDTDLALIRRVLARFGVEIAETDAGARRVKAAGTIAALSEAFRTSLRLVSSPGLAGGPGVAGGPGGIGGPGLVEHRYRVGGLSLPTELDGVVLAVFGLDDRPQAAPQLRWAPAVGGGASYTPPQVAQAYGFPAGTDGTGHGIALIELGGGFGTSDLDSYFSGLGVTNPSVTAASVDGAANVPGGDPSGADGEVLLDIEVAGSIAPGASQVVYFAPNTDQGFVDAVTTAVHATPTPTVLSISWGRSEDSWTAQARSALDQAFADAAALGITVCVAAGDNGSADGQSDGQAHVDFPASSPHALACGGTSISTGAAGGITAETVWNNGSGGGATGGGVSDTFTQPSWQATAGVPSRAGGTGPSGGGSGGGSGRGVPDVAGNADPATGYQVLVDGKPAVVGGTSAVAPLWAALVCRMAQAAGKPFGLIQPLLYAGVTAGTAAAGFRDITSGSNGDYAAGPGWDACTGLGSPDGTALTTRLGG